MGIDFYDNMQEETQKEKERFGQRINEIENELFNQRRKIEELEKENEQLRVTVDTISKHILELQADKGRLTDIVRKFGK